MNKNTKKKNKPKHPHYRRWEGYITSQKKPNGEPRTIADLTEAEAKDFLCGACDILMDINIQAEGFLNK
jgi:hypothetical protein